MTRRHRLALALSWLSLCSPAFPQVTRRISVSSGGVQGDGFTYVGGISADGRYVVFDSDSTNLVPGDTNGDNDVFVRDTWLGTIELVSVGTAGIPGTGDSLRPAISADGRWVVFSSRATDLIPGGTNGEYQVFLRDRELGITEIVSVDSAGVQGISFSDDPSVSDDGRFVAFMSGASNLVPGDLNWALDVFVRDRSLGTTVLASVATSDAQGNSHSQTPRISGDGRWIVFGSNATNLAPGDGNGVEDIFVRDLELGLTERVSVSSTGTQSNGDSQFPSISADGRFVVFRSFATNLVPGDTNGAFDGFLRDRQAGTMERVNLSATGTQGDGIVACSTLAVSADGRFVAFDSESTNLVTGDDNGRVDVFMRDRELATTERISVSAGGRQGDSDSYGPRISGDGRWVAFYSYATNLVPADTNARPDGFLRDLDPTGFASTCDPGLDGVIDCPCGNPPGGPGAGCDNSAATGGAILSASGLAYLASDTLVFRTTGERATALSVLLQGTASAESGVVYGQGVRCVGGSLKRLFSSNAVLGGVVLPGAGDPSVSAKSAAKGSPISAGQSRWYLVYYRDPVVLGGCPVASAFNATQTGRIDWRL